MTGVEKVHDLTPNPKPTLIQNTKNKTYLIYTYSFFQNS